MKMASREFTVKNIFILLFCVILTCCSSSSGLKATIQQEFDSNPFLKEEKIKLTAVKEENGYVTVEIGVDNWRENYKWILLSYISDGKDLFASIDDTDLQNYCNRFFARRRETSIQKGYSDLLKSYNAVKKAIEVVKAIKGVKLITLVASSEYTEYRYKSMIAAGIGAAESIRGSLAGYAATSAGNIFPSTIKNWQELVSVCNQNGATLNDIITEQGYSEFTYESKSAIGGNPNEAGSYVMHVIVDGVPDGMIGKVIEIKPDGLTKFTKDEFAKTTKR
jgi:hypothetical protein